MDLVVTSTPEGRSVRRWPAPATGLRISEYEASMENYQAQPYGLRNSASNYACNMQRSWPKPRNFVNMVRIEEYQEGSVHTVQEGGSSSPSSTASNGSIHTELQLRDDEEVDYDLDIPDHTLGFSRFPSFPPRRGDLINVVSNDEPRQLVKQKKKG